MRTIRKGTFETNSSSCHTITVETTPRIIEEFNEGKRLYFIGFRYGASKENDYKHIYDFPEGFYTCEELFEVFQTFIKIDNLAQYTRDSIDNRAFSVDSPISRYSKYFERDFPKLKEWVIKHASVDLIKFAFTDFDDFDFFSKTIIYCFVQGAFSDYTYGFPILTKDELLSTNITFNTTEWGTDYSAARWGGKEIDGTYDIKVDPIYAENPDKTYKFVADIRDN